ncbi:MAG: hypothetical protein LBS05_04610 [Tannerellaceae bacterium]|jgi:hypothetical protein|nr:hypothetical protein [Tannerellaceae bacterium]
MDKLKDFISNNRMAFDEGISLPEGHFERFEEKLRRRRLRSFVLAAVAVAAAAGLLFFLPIGGDRSDALPGNVIFTCEAEEEIEELRFYYNMQIYDVEAQIIDLYAGGGMPGSIELMKETEQVIRTTCDFETDILPSLPCSEAGVFVLNQHYSNSLNSLNLMLNQMKRIASK